MTIHQLATLLEHLQLGFGDGLKSETGKGFTEAILAFREIPDQSLKELVKSVKKANAPETATTTTKRPKSATAAISIPTIIERIRAIRDGTVTADVELDLTKLNNSHLKEILKAFGKQVTTTTAGNGERVKQLCRSSLSNGVHPVADDHHEETVPSPELDPSAIQEGVRIFTELRDNRSLTIEDVPAGFERLRQYPKPIVEEISRRLKYTPTGSRTEILDRLLSNLEGLKMNQYRMGQILN